MVGQLASADQRLLSSSSRAHGYRLASVGHPSRHFPVLVPTKPATASTYTTFTGAGLFPALGG